MASEWVTPRCCPGGGCSCSRGEGHLRVLFCEGTWRQQGKKPFGKMGVGVPLPCPEAPRLDAALLSCVPSLGSCPLKAGPVLLASPKRWSFPGPDVLLGLEHRRMNVLIQPAPPEHSHRAAEVRGWWLHISVLGLLGGYSLTCSGVLYGVWLFAGMFHVLWANTE